MKKSLTLLLVILYQLSFSQSKIEGTIFNENKEIIPYANIILDGSLIGTTSNKNGYYKFENLKSGTYKIKVSYIGYNSLTKAIVINNNEVIKQDFILESNTDLDEVEVFGNRFTHPDKIEAITRLPLAPYEQIQSISIISHKLIEQQGSLNIADAVRNVPGVYTFATYGGRRESISSRGFRGIPILKNGVRVNSDFRGLGILTDNEGVDNMQVLKGSAAITQGVATDLGSPGGVVNIVTKTPKDIFGGHVSLRAGSFGQGRTSFDVYGPLDIAKNITFRINGALQTADSYRSGLSSDRFYINPSFKWKVSDKTNIILEMDYMDDSRTPDLGTVNLGPINEDYSIYDLPYNTFLGYNNDKSLTKNKTYSIRFNHKLNNNLNLRAAYYSSKLNLDSKGATLGRTIRESRVPVYNKRSRAYSISTRDDDNSVLQFDLVGKDVKTGSIKHTFQVGLDYRTTVFNRNVQRDRVVDTIDVFSSISHTLPTDNILIDFEDSEDASSRALGFVAQDVITFNSWFKTFLALRYSKTQSQSTNTTSGIVENDAFTPLIGAIFTPIKNINLFASYTNSSYPRTSTRLDVNGSELGAERYDQLESGIKTNWLNGRLRFNFTTFIINNRNINMLVYDEDGNETNYYEKGGNDERKGIEAELSGRVLDNLEIIAGYSYIDAQYKDHSQFVYGSAPLNTPKQTYNVYANYSFKNALDGLSTGAGIYYTSKRPIDDWRTGNDKPFNIKSNTQTNARIAYKFNNNWNFSFMANNIFNKIAYNAYRTSFINQTAPRNFSGILSYSF